jgi:hypothetical protein
LNRFDVLCWALACLGTRFLFKTAPLLPAPSVSAAANKLGVPADHEKKKGIERIYML